MKRREFLRKAGAGALGAAALAACGRGEEATGAPAVHTAERVQWRLASSFPRGLDTIWGAAETLAQRVEAMSGGRFKIRAYPAGEIVPGLQVLDAVQQGTVQVGQTASYYYIGKDPSLAFDTALPFGLSARQHTAWLHEAGGRELLAPVFADFGAVAFYAGSTGAQMGGWFNREIGSVADLRGLKMRIPGLGGDVLSRLGVTVQVLAGGDIYPALERGAIDATEWIGPYDDEKLGFHKAARFYYYPGWWEPGPGLTFLVAQPAWQSLSPEFQAIFESAALHAGLRMQAQYDARNPEALARLLAHGVELRAFPPDVMQACFEQSEALSAEFAAKDARYAKILESWRRFRGDAHRWFGTTELAMATFSWKPPA